MCKKDFKIRILIKRLLIENINFSLNCPKFDILINIWKEIDHFLLPCRFCGSNIFTFPENQLFMFASCELLMLSGKQF